MGQKASDLFVSCLENEGVEQIFGVPGEENLDLVESLRASSIELIVTRNEQSAVFMAATYGRLTGQPGVALATLGPGATNMMTGVAHAQLGGMPVMVITGQKPIRQSKQGHFQVLDVVSMMEPVTKWSKTMVDIHRIPAAIRQGYKLAVDERPGAVHLELPEDIARETTDEQLTPISNGKVRRPEIDEKMLTQLVEKLNAADQPVILIGAGANRKRITKYLGRFIQQTNMPFFTSQMGKGVIDERLPQCLGTAALTTGDYIHEAIDKADCILTVGFDLIEKPTNLIHDDDVELIHINFYPAEIDELYMPSLEVVGDIGNTFWQLCEDERIQSTNRNFSEINKINAHNREKMRTTTEEEYEQSILGPRRLAQELREILGIEDILALDNGLYKVWLARNYWAAAPNTVLLDNALATMGAGLSTALVAKMLNPDKQVVCVTGDGGLLMNLGDLETATRLGVNLTILIMNDHAYGMIKRKQQRMGFEQYGLDLENPDFRQLAAAFDAQAMRVKTADKFKPTVEKALTQEGVTLVDVRFAYPEQIT